MSQLTDYINRVEGFRIANPVIPFEYGLDPNIFPIGSTSRIRLSQMNFPDNPNISVDTGQPAIVAQVALKKSGCCG